VNPSRLSVVAMSIVMMVNFVEFGMVFIFLEEEDVC
jgi:hypothetical protein